MLKMPYFNRQWRITMGILDIVRFDGLRSRDWLVYKYPSEKLIRGSQLIVQEGQMALFVKGGMVADVFYPGTYTLATENLPILNGLINLPFGGQSPFSAEVYFVNMTVKLDINWGTSDPIPLIDTYGADSLRYYLLSEITLGNDGNFSLPNFVWADGSKSFGRNFFI